MKKFCILFFAFFIFSLIITSQAFAQKDTTEVNLGRKKIIIIEGKIKKEREIENLEKGKETFENEVEKAKEDSEKLKEMNEELLSKKMETVSDSLKISIEKQIEINEKLIAENEKKIEAFGKGIEEIEKGIAQMKIECDSLEISGKEGKSWNFEQDSSKFDAHWSGFQLGFNNFLNKNYQLATDDEAGILRLKPENSIGFSLNLVEYNFSLFKSKHTGFVTGLGFDWNSFSLEDNSDFVVNQNVLTSVAVDPEIRKYSKNKFNMTYLTIPLLFEYQIPAGKKDFFVNFGGTASVRLWSKQKQKYDENGNQRLNRTKDDFELSPFRLGATAKIGYGPISLYANYSFTPLLKTNHGPELYPFTVGLALINF